MNKDPTTKYVFAEFNTNVKLKKTIKMSKDLEQVLKEQEGQNPPIKDEPIQINCIMWLIKWLWKLITNRKKNK